MFPSHSAPNRMGNELLTLHRSPTPGPGCYDNHVVCIKHLSLPWSQTQESMSSSNKHPKHYNTSNLISVLIVLYIKITQGFVVHSNLPIYWHTFIVFLSVCPGTYFLDYSGILHVVA